MGVGFWNVGCGFVLWIIVYVCMGELMMVDCIVDVCKFCLGVGFWCVLWYVREDVMVKNIAFKN